MLLRNVPLDVILPNLSQVTQNQVGLQTVTADLPPSWDYLELGLRVTGIVPADSMQEIRILANGNPIIRIEGEDLDVGFNQYFKAAAFASDAGAGTSDLLTIFLRRLGIRSGSAIGNNGAPVASAYAKDLGYESSINAGVLDKNGVGIRNLRIEVDLVNTPNVPCSIQVLGRCLPQDLNRAGSGLVPRIDRQSLTVSNGQQVNLARPMLQFGDPLHQVLFGLLLVPAAGMTLDNFVLRYNGEQWLVRSAANNALVQVNDNLRDPQAGYYWVDLTERGYGDEFLGIGNAGTDLQLQFTPDMDGAIKIYQFGAGFLG